MRQITFRGKRLDNGEWVYGDLLHVAGGSLIYFGSDTDTASPDIERSSPIAIELFKDEIAVVAPETVSQFTRLRDCNGKDIYEGDIIGSNVEGKHVIEYDEKHARFVAKHYGGNLGRYSITISKSWIDWCSKTVIGNIYDNQDLLKGGI